MSTIHGDDAERHPLLPKVKASKGAPLGCHEISWSTRYYILAALWAGTFLCNLNLTMVATLLPSITSEFKESNQASWIGTAFLLSTCAFTPLYGRLCIVLGRRGACQIALLATAFGTFLCGVSRNMAELAVARFIAGIGAGALQLLTMIVSADMYNMRERGLPQGLCSIFISAGLGLGGFFGGLLNDLFGWRIAFLCQVPLLVLVLIIITNVLCYVTPGQGQTMKEVLSRIDFGGFFALLLTVGLTLTWLSTKFNEDLPWTDQRVIVPLTLCILSLGLLFVVEFYIASEPILPFSLLSEKVPVLVNLSTFFASVSNFSIIYFVPLWFETVSLDTASVAGLHILPHSLAMCFGSIVSGWWIHRTGKYTPLNIVCGILPLCGFIPIVFMQEDSGFITKWFSVFPIGFGNSVVFVTAIIAIQANLPESSIPFGTATVQLFRVLGQVSGVAIASAVFQSRLDAELHQRIRVPHAEKIISDIRHSFGLVKSLPPDLQRAARDAYSASLRTVFIVAMCMMLMGYILRLPIPDAEMKGPDGYTERIDVETVSGSDDRRYGTGPGSESRSIRHEA